MQFRKISERPCPEPDEVYVWLRARIILGHWTFAQEFLRSPLAARLSLIERDLICAQIAAFTMTDLEQNIEILELLDLPADDYLCAERSFTLGLLFSSQSKFRKALNCFHDARASYARAELPRHESIAYFNLFVCAGHLGLAGQKAEHRRELERRAAELDDPTLHAFVARLEAHEALDREDCAGAKEKFGAVSLAFLRLGRQRDSETAQTFKAYAHLKSDEPNAFDAILRHGKITEGFLAKRMEFFAKIAEQNFCDLPQAKVILREALAQSLDGVTLVMLADLLFNSLLRSREYGALLRLYELIAHWPKRYEQAIELIDLRFYPIVAYLSLGRAREGKYLLDQYAYDAKLFGSEVRAAKAMRLRKLLADPSLVKPAAGGGDEDRPVVDLQNEKVVSARGTVSLTGQKVLVKFLELLFENTAPYPYALLFEACYGHSFNPILNQARYHSLIARARKVLGGNRSLLWQSGHLQINPDFLFHYIPCSEFRRKKILRMKKLQSLVARGGADGLSARQIAKIYGASSRTLQMDLRELVQSKTIQRVGQGKATFYKSPEHSRNSVYKLARSP